MSSTTSQNRSPNRKARDQGKGVATFQHACLSKSKSKFRTETPQGALRGDVTQHADVHKWLTRADEANAKGFTMFFAYCMAQAVKASRAVK